jgi:hypothetical protein
MRHRRAFALPDLLIVVVVAALLGCVLVVSGAKRRGLGSQSESLGNLRQIGSITGSYGADYQGRMWGFTWTPTQRGPSQYADLLQYASQGPLQAVGAQMADIVRRRLDLPQYAVPASWLASVSYSHLVLMDYLDTTTLSSIFRSPGDRRTWTPPPVVPPNQPDPSWPTDLWRHHGSSYELPPAFWSPDAVTVTTGAVVQAASHDTYQLINPTGGTTIQLGARPLTQVQFPSNKVLLADRAEWQGARTDVFFLYDHARIPMLMVDGSAAVRVTGNANPGFRPDAPASPFYTVVNYAPRDGSRPRC